MWLDRLPTELDSRILGFLSGNMQALSAFSKVSKYYHSLAEEHLYKHIVLKEYDYHGLKRLFITLLARKSLALHILSFTIIPSHHKLLSKKQKDENNADLWKYTSAVHEVLTSLMSLVKDSSASRRTQIKWLSNILYTNRYGTQTQGDSEDHILAVILCMAFNIEHIDLHLDFFGDRTVRKTPGVINISWKGDVHPFQKLKSLTYSGKGFTRAGIPVLPSMTSVEYRLDGLGRSQTDDPVFTHPLPIPASPLLRNLVLENSDDIPLKRLGRAMRSAIFYNLESLVFHQCKGRVEPELDTYGDFDAVLVILGTHTPNLRSLRWTDATLRTGTTRLNWYKLKRLRKLRTFHTNLPFLVHFGDNDLEALPNSRDIFPEGLEDLVLAEVDPKRILKQNDQIDHDIARVEDLEKAVSKFLLHQASSIAPLKRLASNINCAVYYEDHATDKAVVEVEARKLAFFRSAADELAKVGVAFEVFRKRRWFEKAPKSLCRRGWIAPLPHNVQKREWEQLRKVESESEYSDEDTDSDKDED
jgi:hypothetical protein